MNITDDGLTVYGTGLLVQGTTIFRTILHYMEMKLSNITQMVHGYLLSRRQKMSFVLGMNQNGGAKQHEYE